MPEIDWKIEEASTSSDTESVGSEEEVIQEEPWEQNSQDSEKGVDISLVPQEDDNKCVGEIHVQLFEDETVRVSIPNLGRWTLGRLEKAMSPILRAIQLERAKQLRRSQGLPEEFNMSDAGEE